MIVEADKVSVSEILQRFRFELRKGMKNEPLLPSEAKIVLANAISLVLWSGTVSDVR